MNKIVEFFQATVGLMVLSILLLVFIMTASMVVDIFTGYDFIRDTSRPFFERMRQ